ncbi:hypothetical protein [Paramaledivibacter caminithermalis]|jgi:hypothetical protein|uniref:Uncharacterized protein n=1 Tax=Paramaledivibacter caminithermalis (strain DSM 15212 / CIP 107654 / DViRD3) TaxID=1121301 RepID=A0A1M6M5R6_PARC5|nr:hypothetical protein [Paramaledivibacter caminithermalis]SHJ78831.1 hypothetical protein SAMN02745912_01070 [Paramaledivibacter caminithermalis DSM 15212]
MKKIIMTMSIIFFITSFICFTYENFSIIFTSAIDTITIYNTFIPYNLIKQYNSDNPVKKREAESEIKKICLDAIEYLNWQDYLDYIDLKIYKGNVIPNKREELIIGLNLSKDLSVVCIFIDNDQNYSFFGKIENLLPIEKIKFIEIPDKEYDFLVVYQMADERLGGFYYEKFLEIFFYNSGVFEKKLKEIVFFEEIFKDIWIDETAPENQWSKNMIKNNILFIENHTLYIAVSGIKNKYTTSNSITIPKSSDFKLIYSNSYKYKYYWNKDLLEFNRKENIVTFKNIPVFIIGDSETDYKNLCNFSKNKYKLLTTSGKIIYIDKELIDSNNNN